MRAAIIAFLFVVACSGGNPERSPDPAPSPSAGAGAQDDCVKKCVDSRQMEARSADDIRRDCEKECETK
jgi:hypothetical protein